MGNAMNAFLKGTGAGAANYMRDKKAEDLARQQYAAGAPARRGVEQQNALRQSQLDNLQGDRKAAANKNNLSIMTKILGLAKDSIGAQTQGSYQSWYKQLSDLGLPTGIYPPPEQVSKWTHEQFSQLKGSLGGLKKDTNKPEVKKGSALKRISDISRSMATLEKTDVVTQLIAKNNPELAQYIGQKLDPVKKANLMNAWNNELNYLEKFSGTSRAATPQATGGNSIQNGGGATHTFVPGQGIVPIK